MAIPSDDLIFELFLCGTYPGSPLSTCRYCLGTPRMGVSIDRGVKFTPAVPADNAFNNSARFRRLKKAAARTTANTRWPAPISDFHLRSFPRSRTISLRRKSHADDQYPSARQQILHGLLPNSGANSGDTIRNSNHKAFDSLRVEIYQPLLIFAPRRRGRIDPVHENPLQVFHDDR